MKLIRTVDAAGQVLCHDITQIIPGEYKDARFRKGHVIQPEDIPVLLSIGKENLYVWEKHPGILHEDEAAALLYKAAAGKNIHGTAPKEGKIELIADCDGLLKINRKALMAVNSTPQMMIATIHGDLPVKKGQKLAGTRIIPLVIEQEKMDAMQAAAGAEPILNVLPMQAKKVGIITTGSEVFKGRIEDKFTPILQSKLVVYGCEMVFHKVCDDDPAGITAAILDAQKNGLDETMFTECKKTTYGNLVREQNNVSAVTNALVASHMAGCGLYDTMQVLSEMTLEDCNRFLREEVDVERMTLSIIAPAK